MYERMLDKQSVPTTDQIAGYIGADGVRNLQILENQLTARYDLRRELRFPFGNSYGWGYKYSHKSKHLFYLFFEKEAITAMMQLGDHHVPEVEDLLPSLSPEIQALWADRYPCGTNGGWIKPRILTEADLEDILKLVEVKQKPQKPASR
ncbi:DUF3788 domain-containing protein [Anaerolentibacter hominis]|uniref:DUF3788 domain-containing protein n=1 Tax=Anaerolentibacter hominis TaxID=3079009 RepID=UPI0031B7F593